MPNSRETRRTRTSRTTTAPRTREKKDLCTATSTTSSSSSFIQEDGEIEELVFGQQQQLRSTTMAVVSLSNNNSNEVDIREEMIVVSDGRDLKEQQRQSEIRVAVEELSSLLSEGGGDGGDGGGCDCVYMEEKKVSTFALLALSNLLLHVLDKVGPTMAVLRQDIQRNIQPQKDEIGTVLDKLATNGNLSLRLEDICVSNPSIYACLAEVLKKESDDGTARKADSCSKAVVWLTRAVDFSLALLERLQKDSELSLVQMVEEAYDSTLKPWHGWISSAAYKVALKLIPDKDIFLSLLISQGQDYNALKGEIKNLVPILRPFLDEIYETLRKFKLDKLKTK